MVCISMFNIEYKFQVFVAFILFCYAAQNAVCNVEKLKKSKSTTIPEYSRDMDTNSELIFWNNNIFTGRRVK